jgi:putative transposase
MLGRSSCDIIHLWQRTAGKGRQAKDGRQSKHKKERYWTGAHTTHKLRYHLVFVPKYRKRVLQGEVAKHLEALLHQACEINRWNLEEIAIQPDHVHLLVQVQPKYSVSYVVNLLKGGTSRVLRLDFPDLEEHLWGVIFWADGFFAARVGVVEGLVVTEYIQDQRL